MATSNPNKLNELTAYHEGARSREAHEVLYIWLRALRFFVIFANAEGSWPWAVGI
jgi:hypothetical protein